MVRHPAGEPLRDATPQPAVASCATGTRPPPKSAKIVEGPHAMKDPRKAVSSDPPEVLRTRIEEFVRGCRSPAVFEAGEQTIPLEPGRFDLQIQGGTLVLHAWNEQSSVVRRI